MGGKLVYLFTEADSSMRELLGGKGANLGEMTHLGLPVPPGFTICTEACRYYSDHGRLPEGLMDQVREAMGTLEAQMGARFGGHDNPLLVSVRSGAAVSMPGMMDTVLNLGLNRDTLAALIRESGDERFALDANRRLLMMFSDVALGISRKHFERIFDDHKRAVGVTRDTDLGVVPLRQITRDFLALVLRETGAGFPSDPYKQLQLSIEAVFRSWNNERAVVYRRTEGISAAMGTAVNIQVMVFGNRGSDCGTGVAFTRDPSTGEHSIYGEYLMNAQGEDVVAGVRTPHPIAELNREMPLMYDEFRRACATLERHYKEMLDLEFTIERGRFWMLQCRVGKRTGPAALRIAVDMADEGLISRDEAVCRVTAAHIDQLLHPRLDEAALAASGVRPLARGIAASPGAAVGRIVFEADDAEAQAAEHPVILVREETTPEDIHGLLVSKGVLTHHGGKTSHAAVVARGFGIPCIAGCEAMTLDMEQKTLELQGQRFAEGDWLTVDGSSGDVYGQALDLVVPEVGGQFERFMGWCDERRRLGVRANADNARDALRAIEYGAEGIGLCRTEHMFFEQGRLPIVREMILTSDEHQRDEALRRLQVVQQSDFEALLLAMDGRPLTIRLIDPPLHEFLPNYEELVEEVTELRLAANVLKGAALNHVLDERVAMLKAVQAMREHNPMMGLRGVRLSIMLPGLVAMQTRALFKAAIKVKRQGVAVRPEIMIPLVGHVNELRVVRAQLEAVAREEIESAGVDIPYAFGTMIEIPRAALTAGEIASEAEFFSFGTNDLTQTTFGFSRDDVETHFLQRYLGRSILPSNPFQTIDVAGVGQLMSLAVREGRATKPDLKCGICGEHGGDPASIDFCHRLGLDYVSCSPYRVPIARLAAAQAALREKREKRAQAPAATPEPATVTAEEPREKTAPPAA